MGVPENSALHNQRRGNKSGKLQDEIVKLANTSPGLTIDQLSWMAAGFKVDAQGFCQPSELYTQVQKYFNGKRRGSEAARTAQEVSQLQNSAEKSAKAKLSKTKLVYVTATCNPYTEAAGKGVRPYRVAGGHTVDHGLNALPVSQGDRLHIKNEPVESAVKVSDVKPEAVDPAPEPAESKPASKPFDQGAVIANLNDLLGD